jgi:hypothetical protein
VGGALDKASLLGAVNEARDRRPVQSKANRQLADLEPSISEDPEHPKLRERKIIFIGELAENGHHPERRRSDGVD